MKKSGKKDNKTVAAKLRKYIDNQKITFRKYADGHHEFVCLTSTGIKDPAVKAYFLNVVKPEIDCEMVDCSIQIPSHQQFSGIKDFRTIRNGKIIRKGDPSVSQWINGNEMVGILFFVCLVRQITDRDINA